MTSISGYAGVTPSAMTLAEVEATLTLRQVDKASIGELAEVIVAQPTERRRIERRLVATGRRSDVYTLSRAVYHAARAQQSLTEIPLQEPDGAKPRPETDASATDEAPQNGETPLPPEIEAALAELDAATAARIERILRRINDKFLMRAWGNIFAMITLVHGDLNGSDDWSSATDRDREEQRKMAASGITLSGDRLVIATSDGQTWSINLEPDGDAKAISALESPTPFSRFDRHRLAGSLRASTWPSR